MKYRCPRGAWNGCGALREVLQPIPTDSTIALAAVISTLPLSMPANTTPTAMPSGILCSVTASTSISEAAYILRFHALGLIGIQMQVKDKRIKHEQKQHARQNRSPQAAMLPEHPPSLPCRLTELTATTDAAIQRPTQNGAHRAGVRSSLFEGKNTIPGSRALYRISGIRRLIAVTAISLITFLSVQSFLPVFYHYQDSMSIAAPDKILQTFLGTEHIIFNKGGLPMEQLQEDIHSRLSTSPIH